MICYTAKQGDGSIVFPADLRCAPVTLEQSPQLRLNNTTCAVTKFYIKVIKKGQECDDHLD